MRTKIFAERNRKELLRDPLSYIFCLGFPLIMLAIMTVVNNSIPKEANMVIFRIDYLSSGIAVFGLAFIMLFTCLQVSKDRSSAFLLRLYASPMKASEFIVGYLVPLFGIALLQAVISYGASFIIGLLVDMDLRLERLLLATLVLVPAAFTFIAIGLLFGTLCNEKAAPGLCSIIITVSAMLGGIWMDVENLAGGMKTMCEVLPFYHMVMAARKAVRGEFGEILQHLLIVCVYMIIIFVLAIVVFAAKRQKDLR